MSEIEDLKRRLDAAERVCVLLALTGIPQDTDEGRAAYQAHAEWMDRFGADLRWTPTKDDILELAARRDVTRNLTVMRLQQQNRQDEE